MAYDLPERGDPNWDTKLNASIEAVKETADAAPETVAADIEGGTGPVATALTASFVQKIPAATGVAATDTANILGAVAAAVAAGGGQLVAGGGTYLVNEMIEWPTSVVVSLDLAGSTFKMANGADLPAVLQTEGWDDLTGTGSSEGMTRCRIANGTIDANKANNTVGYAGRLYGWAYEVTNVIWQNGSDGGLVTEWGADRPGTTNPDREMSAIFNGVRTLSSDGDGWTHHGPHDSVFLGCSSVFNTGKGWTDAGAPAGANPAGSHILNFNAYSNSGTAFETNSGGLVAQDLAVSGPGPCLVIGPDSGPCRIDGLTSTSLRVESGMHQISGLLVNGVDDPAWDDALTLDGAAGCVFDLKILNAVNGINFTGDAGNMFTVSISTGVGQTGWTGTPSAGSTVRVLSEGDDEGQLIQIRGDAIFKNSVRASQTVHGAAYTGTETYIGAAGPGGEAGIDFYGDKLYRASPGIMQLVSWLRVQGNLIAGYGAGGGWNDGHLLIGGYHLWVDSTGNLRIKSSSPASDTDGTVVGSQS